MDPTTWLLRPRRAGGNGRLLHHLRIHHADLRGHHDHRVLEGVHEGRRGGLAVNHPHLERDRAPEDSRPPVVVDLAVVDPGRRSVVLFIVYLDIAKSFGHGIGFALGLFFLAPIFWLILGFGSSRYVGPGGVAPAPPMPAYAAPAAAAAAVPAAAPPPPVAAPPAPAPAAAPPAPAPAPPDARPHLRPPQYRPHLRRLRWRRRQPRRSRLRPLLQPLSLRLPSGLPART